MMKGTEVLTIGAVHLQCFHADDIHAILYACTVLLRTDGRSDKPRTVTLAAHVRRALITVQVHYKQLVYYL